MISCYSQMLVRTSYVVLCPSAHSLCKMAPAHLGDMVALKGPAVFAESMNGDFVVIMNRQLVDSLLWCRRPSRESCSSFSESRRDTWLLKRSKLLEISLLKSLATFLYLTVGTLRIKLLLTLPLRLGKRTRASRKGSVFGDGRLAVLSILEKPSVSKKFQ